MSWHTDGALLNPYEVIRKYPKLVVNISQIGRLAVRLASVAYFGKDVLRKCSVYGHDNKEALPLNKVFAPTEKLLSVFPQYRASSVEFEP